MTSVLSLEVGREPHLEAGRSHRGVPDEVVSPVVAVVRPENPSALPEERQEGMMGSTRI